MQDYFVSFFTKHPALLTGLLFLLGLSFAEKGAAFFFFLAALLLFPFYQKKLLLLLLSLLFFLAWGYGKCTLSFFPPNTCSIEGTGVFIPQEIKILQTHYKKTYKVKGLIPSFGGASHISCSLPLESPSLLAKEYAIKGTLTKTSWGFSFKSQETWTPIESGHFSLVEKRFRIKQALASWIRRQYSSKEVSSLFIALVLGDLDNAQLRYSFGRLGLQHILAISGFHFGLLSFLLALGLRLFLKGKALYLTLQVLLLAYFLLLGPSPAITRAYLAVFLYLIAKIGGWRTNQVNILGAVLLFELILFPRSLQTLGFQLSFLATGAILLLAPQMIPLMEKIFPKRSKQQIDILHPIEKILYKSCCLLKGCLVLNFAVHLALLPVCLFYFGSFPLTSILYNLIFPGAISLSLLLFFTTLPFLLLCPPFGAVLQLGNELFTRQIISSIIGAPRCLDLCLQVPPFPKELLLAYLAFLFLQAFYLLERNWRMASFISLAPYK